MTSSYFSNRAQQAKINDSFSKRSHVVHDVPESSILDRLVFNIYLTDLFYESEESNIFSYADDTTLHSFFLSRNSNSNFRFSDYFKQTFLLVQIRSH